MAGDPNDSYFSGPEPQKNIMAGDRDPFTGAPVYGEHAGYLGPEGGLYVEHSSANVDARDYRRRAEAAAAAQGVTLGRSSTRQQIGSLALLAGAARGNAPSQAAMLAKQQGEEGVQAGMSMAASARGGPGAQIAAMRGAQMQAARQRQQAAAAGAMARAREMADARGQYAGAVSQARGHDIAENSTQASLEAQQRALNANREQFYERQRSDTLFKDLDNRSANYFGEQKQRNYDYSARDAADARAWEKTKDYVSMGTGGLSGATDAYTKMAAASKDDDDDRYAGGG